MTVFLKLNAKVRLIKRNHHFKASQLYLHVYLFDFLLISLCLTYFIGDDKLKISVNDDFPIEDFFGKDSNQKLVFKEGNKVRPLGSDVKLSNGMKAGFAVVLNKRGGKNLGNGKV